MLVASWGTPSKCAVRFATIIRSISKRPHRRAHRIRTLLPSLRFTAFDFDSQRYSLTILDGGLRLQLGIEHILTGVDHLLFVLCTHLASPEHAKTRRHCNRLHRRTFHHPRGGDFRLRQLPTAPVELTIALSIVFLASELLRDPLHRSHITQNDPWLVAFCFGLLHGLGFAGALAEIGLPHGEIPLALFAFNVGVELGQLGFVADHPFSSLPHAILLADVPS